MFNNLTVRARLFSLIGMMSVLLIIIGFIGLQGMGGSNAGLRTVYLDRTVPLDQLAEMTDLMSENVRQLHLASMHDPRLPESKLHDHPITRHTDVVEKNIAEAERIWKEYMATYLTPEEKVLAKNYEEVSSEMVGKGMQAVMPIFKQGKFLEGNEAMVKVVGPLAVKTMEASDALKGLQVNVAKDEFEKAVTAYERIRLIAIVSIILGVSLAVLIGYVIVRNLMKQLGGEPDYAAGIVKQVAQGDMRVSIATRSGDSTRR
ncbi:MAG: Tar ligand binding domain-containing protein [Gammaproteobacteria bacterium]|nr:Tar ligand binding domain-containing protein [Gammaproteobacteria bacterium]